jgi:hypothetical protein
MYVLAGCVASIYSNVQPAGIASKQANKAHSISSNYGETYFLQHFEPPEATHIIYVRLQQAYYSSIAAAAAAAAMHPPRSAGLLFVVL